MQFAGRGKPSTSLKWPGAGEWTEWPSCLRKTPTYNERADERTRHMSVTSVEKDFDRLTLTVIADFDASPERVWQLWADPRKLERWWGPPTYPATVQQYDLAPGGDVSYFMTGPEGEKYRGGGASPRSTRRSLWSSSTVSPTRTGIPLPICQRPRVPMQLTEHGGGTRMELRTVFDSREEMEQLDSMGMTEGMREAVGQMDALLAG